MAKKRVYLDNGASTIVAPEVIKEMKKYFSKIYANASSVHSQGQIAREALDDARAIIAKEINADPEEIIFTSGGTESDNLAIKGIAYQKKSGHIITSTFEHPAVLKTCEQLKKEGFEITYIPVDKEGILKINKLKEAIKKPNTILVSIMHANNEIGTIQNLEEIGKICKTHNVLFHTDAVQSFTKTKIDVKKQNIDMASFSGHKIHGPKGIGALFVRHKLRLKRLFDGGGHERNLRSGTENVSGAIGFAKAVKIANEKDISRMQKLRERLTKGLLKISNTRLNGSINLGLCNNVNISFEYIEGEAMLLQLDFAGISVSTGSACSSNSLEPSHVLTAIGLPAEKSHGSIRFTLSKYTSKEEIDFTIKQMKIVVENLRKMSALI